MTRKSIGAFGACALIAATLLAPIAARADDSSQQKHKNTWRNLAIGSGALGIIGLVNHNSTEALIGAAGAAYSANRYEQDRHHQSERRSARSAYQYNGGSYVQNNRKYYRYNGQMYYRDLGSGERHIVG